MKALFYKGEDITLTFSSTNDLSTYTSKVVKFFTPFSAVKTASITSVNATTFTATLSKTDTADLKAGRLNIVLEFATSGGSKVISKTIECRLADPYVDGDERPDNSGSTEIVFLQNSQISVHFTGSDFAIDASQAAADALAYKTAAETAKTDALAAQTAAETAQAGAETALSGAQTALTGAQTAKTAAETARDQAVAATVNKADHGYTAAPKTLKAVDDAKVDKTSVVQTTGASLSDVMSQKAVTDELGQLAGNTPLWSSKNQYHVENSGVRSAIIDIKCNNTADGYYYAIEQLFRNHATVKDQIVMKRINASTEVEERFFWNNEAGSVSGKTFISLKAASASSGGSYACDIDMTIDYSLIVEGSSVGNYGTTKMIINPAFYFKASLVDTKISPLSLKIDGFYRTIPDNISTTCVVANGAIKNSESKFTIPVGQTGNDSLINLFPDWTKDLYAESSGISGKYIAKFKVSNWQSRTIDYYLFGSGVTTTKGTGVVSNGVMTCELSQNLSQYSSAVKLYMQLRSGTAVTGSDLVVEFDGFYIDPQTESQSSLAKSKEIYRTEKQILQVLSTPESKEIINTQIPYTLTEITCKRFGTAGVDADFVGLNAIGDALASITDASSQKRYKILCEGIWLFTDPSDFVYDDGQFGEPTVIVGKDWIDVEGLGKDKSVVAVELAAGSVFPSGKIYTDYQPVMWNSNSKLSNMSIIAKNCRYNVHFEGGNLVTNKTLTIDHCYLENKGNVEMGGSAGGTVFGTGMRDGQVWNIANCTIKTEGSAFAMHTALNTVKRGGEVNLINCDVYGFIQLANYPVERIVNVNLIDCRFNGFNTFSYQWYYTAFSVWADYANCMIKCSSKPLLFYNGNPKGKGLRITSKSAGALSTVRFNENSSAFEAIIGDKNRVVEETTLWQWKFKYGYYFKDGGDTLKGFAVGGKDIDEGTTHTSLGKKLGDCTVVNKILTIIIDGSTYNVTFNENYTAQNNAYVISKITSVIGTVADVDTYSPGFEYYPQFDGMKVVMNTDATAILKGMAISFDGDSGVKKATSSDNFSGIALDDAAPGQTIRCITSGRIFGAGTGANRFKILDIDAISTTKGIKFGVSTTNPGFFDRDEPNKVLESYDNEAIMFI